MPFIPGTTNADDGGTGSSTAGPGLVGESTERVGVFGASQRFASRRRILAMVSSASIANNPPAQ